MKKLFISAIVCALFVASGCNESISSDELVPGGHAMALDFSTHSLALTKADSCEAYRKHILDSAARMIADQRYGFQYFYDYYDYEVWDDIKGSNPLAPVAPDAEASSSDNSGSAPKPDFTITNNQEVGVDEVDDVKNDMNWIYSVIDGNDIVIAKAWPVEEAKLAAKIPMEPIDNGHISNVGLLLDGTKLIAIDTVYRYDTHSPYFWYYYANAGTRVRIYDVSDPTQPKLLKTHEMEGQFVQGRLINHRIHLVLSASTDKMLSELSELYFEDIPGLPKFNLEEWHDDYSLEKRKERIDKYLPFIRGWLEEKYPDTSFIKWPQYSDGTQHKALVSCEDVYIPGTSSNEFGMLMMTEISGQNYENVTAQAISDNGWTVYASQKNIYVVSSSNDWTYDCYEDSSCHYYSHIHRFDLGNGEGLAHYANSGEVDGIINSQFFMSEYNDYLRVASDENLGWSDKKNGSRLSILSLNGPQMKVVSSIGDIGNGESLFAARMFGAKGYMVTYEQKDPLFTFDLSDPFHPVKKGELHINGYSSYIHLMDENHLLTIGEDGTETGTRTGLHLQVFDVTDLANPIRSAHEVFEYTDHSHVWSPALDDHHAFNYHAGSRLLSIPMVVDTWTNTPPYENNYWGGEYIYRVSPDKFDLLGKISTDEQEYFNRSRFYFADSSDYSKNAYVYSIAPHVLKINDANAPASEFKSIRLDK